MGGEVDLNDAIREEVNANQAVHVPAADGLRIREVHSERNRGDPGISIRRLNGLDAIGGGF